MTDPFAQTDEERAAFAEKLAYWRANGLNVGTPRQPRRRTLDDGTERVERVNELDGSMSGFDDRQPDGIVHTTITPVAPRFTPSAGQIGV